MFLIGFGQILYLSAAFVLLGLIVLGRFRPRPTPSWVRRIELFWRRFAEKRATVLVLISVLSMTLCVSASLVRFPQPRFQDEFSYLLAADTFASGRLTNPTHPAWRFFASPHVLHEPTYMSKYPPGQGLFLALGQVIWHPLLGVWVSTALAAVAICWMLQGWVPARWALFGGILAALHTGLHLKWAASYWGGAVALLGGALVLGALPRIEKSMKVSDSLWLGLGTTLLALSRPLEGMILCMPVGVRISYTVLWSQRKDISKITRRFLIPFAGTMALAFVWMGYFNWRVTGDVLTMPYQVYSANNRKAAAPKHDDPQNGSSFGNLLERLSRVEADPETGKSATWRRKLSMRWHRFYKFELKEFLGFPLVFLAGLSLFSIRSGTTRFQLAVVTWCHAVQFLIFLKWPHYLAPVFPFVFAIAVQGARASCVFARRNSIARIAFIAGFLGLYVVWLAVAFHGYNTYKEAGFRHKRPKAIEQLSAVPGNHLIICRYEEDHNRHAEYVYNRANIDRAKIVWAHEMSPEANMELFQLFPNRRVWLYEPDRGGRLNEYPRSESDSSEEGESDERMPQ